ncbi:MAG: type II toxin-antitoxin system VapC family toxin [Dehalococcoidia bacterium]|nr:type II toxin-antitoxin system VapC family toxin [Dehalococcoidia bacterium]
MYLVDSNIWLERILEQERADEVRAFIERTPARLLYITELALYSIGILLVQRHREQALRQFLEDLSAGSATVVRLSPEDLSEVITACEDFNLDFDDGYQYVAARKHGLTLVTFDRNFTHTDIEPVSPSQLV